MALTSLSSGSRKTRIETLTWLMAGGGRGWSKQWFQKNKDWNHSSLSQLSNLFKSKQWFQKNKDWNSWSIIILLKSWVSKQWFQKNKDWNLKSQSPTNHHKQSKQWFQKNKDWNISRSTSAVRSSLSKQWFQKNKDWNYVFLSRSLLVEGGLSSGSRKTRIETGLLYCWRPLGGRV